MALSSLAATCMPASLASLALGAAVLQHWAVMAIRAINRKPEWRVIFFFMVLDYCGRFVQQMVLYEKCLYLQMSCFFFGRAFGPTGLLRPGPELYAAGPSVLRSLGVHPCAQLLR